MFGRWWAASRVLTPGEANNSNHVKSHQVTRVSDADKQVNDSHNTDRLGVIWLLIYVT